MTDQLTEVDMLSMDAAIEATREVKLPCDVRVGAGTFKRGVPVATMLMSLKNHIGYAKQPGYPFTDGYLDKRPVMSGVVGCSICHGSGVDVAGNPCPMVHMHRAPRYEYQNNPQGSGSVSTQCPHRGIARDWNYTCTDNDCWCWGSEHHNPRQP